MLTKLFVFGFPGSGKSTVAQYIVSYVNFTYKHWVANRVSDYNILYNMAHREKKSKNFYLMNYRGTEGFYVSNPAKYNEALKDLEQLVDSYQTKTNRLLVIEFARSDYARAFKVFKEDFFRNSSFLYVYADMNVCLQRIEERIRNPHSRDDHYVSNYTFENYLGKNDIRYPLQVRSELVSTYTGKTVGSKSLIVTARCTKHNCRRSPLWTRLSEREPHFGLGKCKKYKRLRKGIQKVG